jgi:predicted ferric reductase
LADRISQHKFKALRLDGPYGKNHHPERYHTVVLVAQGIGIAGLLSYIGYLEEWKSQEDRLRKRELITRKVDLHWLLDDNSEFDSIAPHLEQLRKKGTKARSPFPL